MFNLAFSLIFLQFLVNVQHFHQPILTLLCMEPANLLILALRLVELQMEIVLQVQKSVNLTQNYAKCSKYLIFYRFWCLLHVEVSTSLQIFTKKCSII
jgi:hypothetical protein